MSEARIILAISDPLRRARYEAMDAVDLDAAADAAAKAVEHALQVNYASVTVAVEEVSAA